MAQFIKIDMGSDSPDDELWVNVGNIVLLYMLKGNPAMRMNNGLILVGYHETMESLRAKIEGEQPPMVDVPDAFLNAWNLAPDTTDDEGDAQPT